MKKISLIVVGVGILVLIGIAGNFYWKNLRGIWPVLKKPPQDISDLINSNTNQTSTPEVNSTNFPLALPDGFSISIYARGVAGARVMTHGPDGALLVSMPEAGKVVSLRDNDGDGSAESIVTVIEGLRKPHGLATRCTDTCKLYIAEENQVAMYDYDSETHQASNKKKLVDLPSGGRHTSRTIMFMPAPNDERLLISVGSSCDVCHEQNQQRGTILSVKYDGTDLKTFAKGLRNSVFMSIHPVTGDIWATEMGRDYLGDSTPPDEINIVTEGGNYGWPICYGKNIHDTNFDKNTYVRNPCMEPTEKPSHIDIPAHSAPLGIAFFPEEGWPQEYWHNALVAYHGSWNRTKPTGYKIVRYKLDERGSYVGEEDFISGWLTDTGAHGRPVDILIQPGGTIFVSDDKAGVIYKVRYRRPDLQTDSGSNSNMIRLESPNANDLITSPVTIKGEARGNWYFEASFPLQLQDANGKILKQWYAQAKSDWMTENFVPFELQLDFPEPTTDTGTLILQRDNPSGLPENDAEIRIPVRFR